MELVVQIYSINEEDNEMEVDIVRPFTLKEENTVISFIQDVLDYANGLEEELREV